MAKTSSNRKLIGPCNCICATEPCHLSLCCRHTVEVQEARCSRCSATEWSRLLAYPGFVNDAFKLAVIQCCCLIHAGEHIQEGEAGTYLRSHAKPAAMNVEDCDTENHKAGGHSPPCPEVGIPVVVEEKEFVLGPETPCKTHEDNRHPDASPEGGLPGVLAPDIYPKGKAAHHDYRAEDENNPIHCHTPLFAVTRSPFALPPILTCSVRRSYDGTLIPSGVPP